MRSVIVIGAGLAGLAAALAFGRRGFRVTLCERDAAPVPARIDDMCTSWPRPGTPQAQLLHIFQPRFCRELRSHAPDILDRADQAGAVRFSTAASRAGVDVLLGDPELDALYCRRPIMEGVMRHAVDAEPGVETRPGFVVEGLIAQGVADDALPQVVGVRSRDGRELYADAVVVAGGRHAPVAAWLAGIGAAAPEEVVAENGGLYFCRSFRVLPTATDPIGVAPPQMLHELGYLRAIVSPGDAGTFWLVLRIWSEDRGLRVLHEPRAFMAAARSVAPVAPWLTPQKSVPLGPVETQGRLDNMLRRFVVAGRPLALGLFVIGDARCHTDPIMGWGAGLGVSQAFTLADVLTRGPADPLVQALAFEDRVAGELAGWYRLVVEQNRAQTRAWQGVPDPPPQSAEEDFEGFVRKTVMPAMAEDAAVCLAVRRRLTLLDPPDALARNTGVLARAATLAAARRPSPTPAAKVAPERDQLLAIVASQTK